MSHRLGHIPALIAVLVLALHGERAEGTKYDTCPKPCRLLAKAKRVLALSGADCLTSYGLEEGGAQQDFRADGDIEAFDVAADERFVAFCGGGKVAVWDLRTGRRLWGIAMANTGRRFAVDLQFAWDGQSFVIGDWSGATIAYETETGREAWSVSHPADDVEVMSAALSPDGSEGALVLLGKRLVTYSSKDKTRKATGIIADRLVRYSSDGKHVACRGEKGVLQVVTIGDVVSARDVEGLYPKHVRPIVGGGFLVTGVWWTGQLFGPRHELRGAPVGVKVAATGTSVEVWRAVSGEPSAATYDFDPGLMMGAETTFNLVTRVFNLRTGAVLRTIDNSRTYKPTLLSTNSGGAVNHVEETQLVSWQFALVAGMVLILIVGFCVFVIRRLST